MSISSSAVYSPAPIQYPTSVIQTGLLTFVATQTCTVACSAITATSRVLLRIATQTARTTPDVGLDGEFTVAITAGTGFTAVSLDVAYAGTVEYVVLNSSAPVVNVTSA
jgi:hypothetical protein